MKNAIIRTSLLVALFISGIALQANAQKISFMTNIKVLGADQVQGLDKTNIEITGKTSFSGNMRVFIKNRWALRTGIGVDKLKYRLSTTDGAATNFDVVQKHLTGYLGLEKHFKVAMFRPYLGAYVPISFNAKDDIKEIGQDVGNQFSNGDVVAGLNLVGGVTVGAWKFMRFGVEGNLGFDSFKDEVVVNVANGTGGSINWKNLGYGVQATVGVEF